MLNKIKQQVTALRLPAGINRTWLLMGVGGAGLAGAIVLSLWRGDSGYVALYGAREKLPVAQVVEVLGAEKIPYRVNPDNGQILVTETALSQARMALAAKGITALMPEGYGLMDKEEMLGSSQFMQNVRYKRSLEGELARSIMALEPVESARVHLGISEASSFVIANRPDSSASVVLQLHYGQQLSADQVAAIVQLVAGSVPGMKAASVRVVDQAGALLSEQSQNGGASLAEIRQGRDVVQRIQEETTRNIARILTPLVGADNFRISVMPSVDLSHIEETQERLGSEPRISDENLSEEQVTNELALGIPGSLSNRPATPPPAAAPVQQNGAQQQDTQQNDASRNNPASLTHRNQQQRKYAFDRDIRHIRHPGQKLEKLRVAVALNLTAPALSGITDAQRSAITRLVADAAGIEEARGDSLTLDLLAFTAPPKITEPTLRWWQDPAIQYWGLLGGIGLLALLTLLFAVRPLIQRIVRPRRAAPEPQVAALPSDTSPEAEQTSESEEKLNIGLAKSAFQEDDSLPPQSSGLETKVEYLQMLAQSETERVAEVLKQWINSNERSHSKQEQ